VILGVALALVATVAFNTGFVLEKGALAALPPLNIRLPLYLARMLITTPRWVAGFTLIMTGLAAQLVALTRIPLTVAQPVLSSGIVFLLLLTMTFLGERLTSHEWTGLAGITAGVVCVVASLDSRTDTAGTGGSVLRVLMVAVPSTLAGLAVFRATARGGGRHRRPAGDVPYGLAAGIVYGVAGMITKGLSASIDFHGPEAIVRSALVSPYLYLFAPVTLAGFLVFQTALQRGRASIVAPVSSVISTLYTVVAGTLMFGEHLPTGALHLGLRLGGLAAITVSLLWLPRQSRTDRPAPYESVASPVARNH
jgi:drug/metabolite transporter (DMT)-like permease